MKVMVVAGGTDSVWTKVFVGKILAPLGCEIYLQINPMESNRFLPYYQQLGVNFVFPYSVNKRLMRIRGIRKWYGYSKQLSVLDDSLDLDYIVCIFGNPINLKCAHKLASPKTKVYTWFIGSDLLRAGKKTLKRVAAWMKKTNSRAVCVTEKLNEEYKKKLDPRGADAIADFVTGGILSGKTKIATLLDGTWFWNECQLSVDVVEQATDGQLNKDNMKFQMMAFPKATMQKVGEPMTMCIDGTSICAINSRTPSWKVDLAKKFVRFAFTNESNIKFTEITSCLRDFDYTEPSNYLQNNYFASNC